VANTYLSVVPRAGLTSEERADAINSELYRLKLPLHLQPEGHLTDALLAKIKHPETGDCALVAQSSFTIRVHEEADTDALVALFPHLSEEEEQAIVSLIVPGSDIRLSDITPGDTNIMTQLEAEATGWFTAS